MTTPLLIVTPLTSSIAGGHSTAPANESVACRLSTAMAGGDEEAFREFHALYFDRLLRYLFVVMRGDEDGARDALQETFLRVVRHVRPFASDEEFWCWLALLARSAATDAGRKRTRYGRMLCRYALFWRREEDSASIRCDEEWDVLLAQAMQALDETDRALVEAKYFGGSSVRELAVQSGLTEKAVESRLGRARRVLRHELSHRLKHEEER